MTSAGSAATIDNGVLKALALELTSMDEIPDRLWGAGNAVREANFSFNSVSPSSLSTLARLPALETLVLDNNGLTSLRALPSLPHLKTLWLNNNELEELEEVLNVLSRHCPQLEYLSLLRNPCCPNELTGKQETEYRRYRLYTKYRLPTLKLLDASPFTEAEATEAREKGKFFRAVAQKAVVPTGASDSSTSGGVAGHDGGGSMSRTTADVEEEEDLFAKYDKKKEEKELAAAAQAGSASAPQTQGPFFTQQRHFYSGKTSEGNRFIKDDVL